MQMWPSDSSGPACQPDDLTGFYTIAHLYFKLRLVPESTENSPPVVDDCSVSADGEGAGENHNARRRRFDWQPSPTAIIDSGMEV